MNLTLSNGKKLEIIEAPFKLAYQLKTELQKCLKGADLKGLFSLDEEDAENDGKIIQGLIGVISDIEGSEEFTRILFECLSYCIYDNFNKINDKIFDDIPELRKDYYTIIANCIEVNVTPFIESLLSELSKRQAIAANNNPEQK